jgi:dihydropteroate synthase
MKNAKLVAILNITPDSYSDGGLYNSPSTVSEQIKKILASNADIIDIGAISTRPNSTSPTLEEERKRFDLVLPNIIDALKNSKIGVSIDSYNYETLNYLMTKLPLAWINDQNGYKDERIISLAKDTKIKLVLMHNITLHVDPKITIPENLDATKVVKEWLLERAQFLQAQGIRKDQIILDPGIGCGKTAIQSWKLIREAKEFVNTGYEILFGHSRKSFMNLITDLDFSQRDLETSAISLYLSMQGVDYLRIHNAEFNARVVKIAPFLQS